MITIHNLTGVYENQDFYKAYPYQLIEQKELSGVRGYLDENVGNTLLEEMRDIVSKSKIHFLDSGNYHHLSYLYTNLIQTRFNLLVFDHHTDMQESAFGSILSCGSWILEALETNSYLHQVIMIGVKEEYLKACPYLNDSRVFFLSTLEEMEEEIFALPIYLSIDKDVLSREEFLCDWDQGEKKVLELLNELKIIRKKAELLGIDVCGEPESSDSFAGEKSNHINKKILEVFFGF